VGIKKNLGLIFDIQRYSIYDGPGIRTLIFMKGCSLRCLWCSNPEGQLSYPEIMYSAKKCIKCWECLPMCHHKAILKNNNSNININRENCINCGKCSSVCYSEALQLVGKYITIDEVLRLIEKDKTFYDVSDGGVTLSGGEPLSQIEFTKELLKACKNKGINTAIETCGYTDWKNIESMIELVDTFFYDIKHMEPKNHLRLTGVSNEVILENLKKLSKLHSNIIVRFPLIPGYNDQEENLDLTVKFFNPLNNIKRIEVLPYHKFGVNKYKRLGKDYKLKDLRSFSNKDKEFQVVKKFFKDNINMRIKVI